ncbi:MAG: hypothetical protein J7J72_05285 [Bacteroidales bacterium]|nr:hypothetical protein [Bacteroidales bacterium]
MEIFFATPKGMLLEVAFFTFLDQDTIFTSPFLLEFFTQITNYTNYNSK